MGEPELPRFACPPLPVSNTGWGPSSELEESLYSSNIFSTFNRSEKLGKISDWNPVYPNRPYNFRNQSRDSQFSYVHAEDDEFTIVDANKSKSRMSRQAPPQRGRWPMNLNNSNNINNRNNNYNNNYNNNNTTNTRRPTGSRDNRNQPQNRRGGLNKPNFRRNNMRGTGYRRISQRSQECVEIKPTWVEIDQIDPTILSKIHGSVCSGQDIKTAGCAYFYDPSFDNVSTKTEKPIRVIKDIIEQRETYNINTSSDPIIQELANEGVANVFGTDVLVSYLMTSPKSVYSWDVVIQRAGDTLFFEKRPDSTIDLISVNETANEIPLDERESASIPTNMDEEATKTNFSFIRQLQAPERESIDLGPFDPSGENPPNVGFRYRLFNLEDDIRLVVRCEVDAVVPSSSPEDPKYYVVRALNDFDPRLSGIDWRQKLDSQRGAILAAEMKNNSTKLARFCAQVLVSDPERFVLGYISRVHQLSTYNLLGLQKFSPIEFANQINVNPENVWGILKTLIEKCLQLPEGKYLLVKEPNKGLMKIYSVPENEFLDDEPEAPLDN